MAQLPGVIPLRVTWGNRVNERRPLLAVSPSWHDGVNEFGVPGVVRSLTTQAALQSSHGSLSPYDMHALFIANGPGFQAGLLSELPTGAIDLLPTLLTLLDLPLPGHLDGRILWEILRSPSGESGEATGQIVESAVPVPSQTTPKLQLVRVGETSYVHGQLC